jgi:hypothetical protein
MEQQFVVIHRHTTLQDTDQNRQTLKHVMFLRKYKEKPIMNTTL